MYELIGRSKWADRIRYLIKHVAGYRCSILIIGPSGTGKELIASAIHRNSGRAKEAFVPVDCTSIPPALFPSQLFGYVKGAFTGAECNTLGSFRAADGGTIFLDEIGELSLDLQCQLLRVIQERAVIPVGSHRSIPVDVRVIAATSRCLEAEVRANRFRLDLFYRLNVVKLTTASLNERIEDIAPITEYFLDRFSVENGLPRKRLTPAAMRFLESCRWPGNVRQLQNILERAVVLIESDEITEYNLAELIDPDDTLQAIAGEIDDKCQPPKILPLHPDMDMPREWLGLRSGSVSWPTLAECERRLFCATLEQTNYNQSAAARLLGIDRRLLARKIRKFEISIPYYRTRVA